MPDEPTPRLLIEVIDLHKAFGGVDVLRGVNLRVPEGRTVVLLGMSGSGKTVLLKHLIGLLRADRGEVWVDGQEVGALLSAARGGRKRKELEALRRQIGILFQSDALFDSLSVYDNIAFGLREQLHLDEDEVDQRVTSILDEVGLTAARDDLPGVLSGGMRKRVAFARAAVGSPKLLLYDEPTAGLDPLTTQSVVEIIARSRERGITTLAVIFDVAAAFAVADELAFLHDGRIVEQGSPEAMLRSSRPEVRAFLQDWLESGRTVHAGL